MSLVCDHPAMLLEVLVVTLDKGEFTYRYPFDVKLFLVSGRAPSECRQRPLSLEVLFLLGDTGTLLRPNCFCLKRHLAVPVQEHY